MPPALHGGGGDGGSDAETDGAVARDVWEWVRDFDHHDYADAPSDGSAWEDPSSRTRIMRGGGFLDAAVSQRTTARYRDAPARQWPNVVRDAP